MPRDRAPRGGKPAGPRTPRSGSGTADWLPQATIPFRPKQGLHLQPNGQRVRCNHRRDCDLFALTSVTAVSPSLLLCAPEATRALRQSGQHARVKG